MAMNEQPPRRWFRFSLRTMFVAVTGLCCWLGWESSVVRERRAVREEFRVKGLQFVAAEEMAERYVGTPIPVPTLAKVPMVRRWLGDQAVQEIWYLAYNSSISESDIGRVKQIFPEAELRESFPAPCHPGCFPRGTLVETPDGLRPIESIQPGEVVTSVLADGAPAEANVQSIFVTDNRLWRIATTAGVLITTETQPLCLTTSKLKAAGELQPGDAILVRQAGKIAATEVIEVSRTDRLEKVYNLILGESEVFVAGGFLARSKPPRVAAPTNP